MLGYWACFVVFIAYIHQFVGQALDVEYVLLFILHVYNSWLGSAEYWVSFVGFAAGRCAIFLLLMLIIVYVLLTMKCIYKSLLGKHCMFNVEYALLITFCVYNSLLGLFWSGCTIGSICVKYWLCYVNTKACIK